MKNNKSNEEKHHEVKTDPLAYNQASQLALVVKNPPAGSGDVRDMGSIPGSGRSPGGGRGSHSSTLAWRIPWTEKPGGLQSTGSPRIRHD